MGYDDEERGSKDPRVIATGIVGGIACGMMALSIPLIAIAGGGGGVINALPVLAVAGAAFSSAAIWLSPKRNRDADELPPQLPLRELEDIKHGLMDIRSYVASLEERIEDQEIQLRITQAAAAKGISDKSQNDNPPQG
ncbi:MAG: hypothetical protein MUF71_15160 [Candidatus Kapabacteria bacterium]|jgi:hypothetical protein|nr:hypothetical protein [Candidatus Kapabacteria bacterium]